MKKFFFNFFVLPGFLTVIFVTNFVIVQGQALETSSEQVQGLTISPFLIETKVEPGQISKHEITITNATNSELPIEVSINDFIPGENGEPTFLNSDQASDESFSLSNWITITKQPEFNILANGQTTLEFAIAPPDLAEPGTHYGGLLISYRVPSQENNEVKVVQKVAVLVLAEIGNAKQQAALTEFRAEPSLDNNRVEFFSSIYNQGNVHLKPKGDITITDMFGRQIGQVPVNRDAAIILPQSQRNFQSSWESGWRFGKYTATAVLYYGSPKLEIREVTTFWIIPWQRLIFVILIIAIFANLAFIGLKRYNRWIINKQFNK